MQVNFMQRVIFYPLPFLLLLILFSNPANAHHTHKKKFRTCDQHPPEVIHRKALPFQRIIDSAAKRYRVDPNLIKAVITAETCFRHNSVSHKGATGLMQLMPATGRRFGAYNRRDIVQNIYAGTRYLSWLSKRYRNRVHYVVAAYNSGEGTVDRYGWRVPYKETSRYTQQVLNAYWKLRAKPHLANHYSRLAAANPQWQYNHRRSAQRRNVSLPNRNRSRKTNHRLLPSCSTSSHRKLKRITTHRDKNGIRTFFYKVKRGDVLGRVMRKTGISTTALKRNNNLRGTRIRTGQKLKVASCQIDKKSRNKPLRSTLKSCKSMTKQLHRATTHRDKNRIRTFYYKVKKGDVLGKVVEKTGSSSRYLKRNNKIRRNIIRPGERLKVAQCRL